MGAMAALKLVDGLLDFCGAGIGVFWTLTGDKLGALPSGDGMVIELRRWSPL